MNLMGMYLKTFKYHPFIKYLQTTLLQYKFFPFSLGYNARISYYILNFIVFKDPMHITKPHKDQSSSKVQFTHLPPVFIRADDNFTLIEPFHSFVSSREQQLVPLVQLNFSV